MVFEHVITKEENHALIKLSGELIEKGQANDLIENCAELIKENIVKWAIDSENLKYMNSSGLNTLIQLLTKARVGGGEAVIYNLNKKINELILITKLNTLFKVAATKEEAFKLLDLNS
jgi:anti-sigma B factor antagonist